MIRPIAYIVTALIGLLILNDSPPQTANLQFYVGAGLFLIGYIGGLLHVLGRIKIDWSDEW